MLAGAEPERPAGAAGDEERAGDAGVEPGGGERAVEALEHAGIVPRVRGEREDRLGVDGHPRLGARAGVGGEQLVVVQDDPVVDPDHRPVADGMVVGRDRGMALRVVADVDEQLGRRLRHGDPLEQLARRRPLLRDDRIGVLRAPVGVADGVGASLGDPCEQGLSRERPVNGAARGKAVAGYAAHVSKKLLGVDPRQFRRRP